MNENLIILSSMIYFKSHIRPPQAEQTGYRSIILISVSYHTGYHALQAWC